MPWLWIPPMGSLKEKAVFSPCCGDETARYSDRALFSGFDATANEGSDTPVYEKRIGLMKTIANQTYDEERALYGISNIHLLDCTFAGPADGESAVKEASDVVAEHCFSTCVTRSGMCIGWTSGSAACPKGAARPSGIRIMLPSRGANCMESRRFASAGMWLSVTATSNRMNSAGFPVISRWKAVLWKATISCCTPEAWHSAMCGSEENMRCNTCMYAVFDHCDITSRDAFWHAHNVTVRNSVLRGEFLGWYSDNLTLEHCRILSSQPLCYCSALKLIDCEVVDSDLCFEKSDVDAVITTPVDSIKNPRSGRIVVPSVDEIHP